MNTNANPPTHWAVERKLANGTVLRLGTVHWVGDGYRFNPWTSARKPSRKSHATMVAALPRWVGYPHRCQTRALEEHTGNRDRLREGV